MAFDKASQKSGLKSIKKDGHPWLQNDYKIPPDRQDPSGVIWTLFHKKMDQEYGQLIEDVKKKFQP